MICTFSSKLASGEPIAHHHCPTSREPVCRKPTPAPANGQCRVSDNLFFPHFSRSWAFNYQRQCVARYDGLQPRSMRACPFNSVSTCGPFRRADARACSCVWNLTGDVGLEFRVWARISAVGCGLGDADRAAVWWIVADAYCSRQMCEEV